MPGAPHQAFASMGNYLFNTDVLIEALLDAHWRDETDFGQHVLPRLLKSHRVFATISQPTSSRHQTLRGSRLLADLGTVDAYFDAHKDVLGDQPRFDAFNPQWPIFSSNYQGPCTDYRWRSD